MKNLVHYASNNLGLPVEFERDRAGRIKLYHHSMSPEKLVQSGRFETRKYEDPVAYFTNEQIDISNIEVRLKKETKIEYWPEGTNEEIRKRGTQVAVYDDQANSVFLKNGVEVAVLDLESIDSIKQIDLRKG